jgi:hypothetical protein
MLLWPDASVSTCVEPCFSRTSSPSSAMPSCDLGLVVRFDSRLLTRFQMVRLYPPNPGETRHTGDYPMVMES